MQEALEVLVGPQAQGLSASTISRLKAEWSEQYQQWRNKKLDKDRWVYIWADGIVLPQLKMDKPHFEFI